FAGLPATPTTSPTWTSSSPVTATSQITWIRPERSTTSRKTSFPIPRRAIARPAILRVAAASAPASSGSASARTAAISSRSGKRLGPGGAVTGRIVRIRRRRHAARQGLDRRSAAGATRRPPPPVSLLADDALEDVALREDLQLGRERVVPNRLGRRHHRREGRVRRLVAVRVDQLGQAERAVREVEPRGHELPVELLGRVAPVAADVEDLEGEGHGRGVPRLVEHRAHEAG